MDKRKALTTQSDNADIDTLHDRREVVGILSQTGSSALGRTTTTRIEGIRDALDKNDK
jgi:hypothetical protein